MIEVVRYVSEEKERWDNFVSHSKNGLFLFCREYMEYHSDRFVDHSLLFLRDRSLVAIMPANLSDDTLHSHGGLTFGGVVSRADMSTPIMLEIFNALLQHLRENGIKKVVYKPTPHIYHTIPSEEDLYALFRHDATLIRRDPTSTIQFPRTLDFKENRLRGIKKASKSGVSVKRSYDFKTFMGIVEVVLAERHDAKPVHTSSEIETLASRFPDNVKLYGAYKDDLMLAGVLVYESTNVAHAQYIVNSNEGRDIGALDLVFSYLINDCYGHKRYFDFGISTEKSGRYLNVGLIDYKEAFGARTIVHNVYELSTQTAETSRELSS